MSPLVWLAWRLPGNVETYRTFSGAEMRIVKFTVWGWIKWRVTR